MIATWGDTVAPPKRPPCGGGDAAEDLRRGTPTPHGMKAGTKPIDQNGTVFAAQQRTAGRTPRRHATLSSPTGFASAIDGRPPRRGGVPQARPRRPRGLSLERSRRQSHMQATEEPSFFGFFGRGSNPPRTSRSPSRLAAERTLSPDHSTPDRGEGCFQARRRCCRTPTEAPPRRHGHPSLRPGKSPFTIRERWCRRCRSDPRPNVLFIHRYGLGQFAPIALALHHQRSGGVALIAAGGDDGVPYPTFAALPARTVTASPPYLRALEAAVLNGQATARAVLALTRSGRFRPDVVVVHPGWGYALFLRHVLPGVPILLYAEYFSGVAGSDLDDDSDLAGDLDRRCALELRNGGLLLGLAAAAAAISPTVWQRNLHPLPYRRRNSVIHEGVDTAFGRPDPSAAFVLPNGRALTRADEVVTYVARDLEPHRGFPALMRALPSLLAARPRAEVLICGGEGVSYGRPPPRRGELAAAPPRRDRAVAAPRACPRSASVRPLPHPAPGLAAAPLAERTRRALLVAASGHGRRLSRARLRHRSGA
ncbi:glycosyltransferase family protein [Elioraea thermophila]|uniref:hypothetical protein n=1 Tax=Elioraea thermophila TaxID=2185104 RepID=UPI000DF24112